MTALYEAQLTGADGRLGTTRLRWRDPTDREVHEITRNIDVAPAAAEFAAADPMLQLNGIVAAWASAMRGDGAVAADARTLAAEAARIAHVLGTPQASEVAKSELIARWADLHADG